jgi:hypothetical protein
MTIKKSVKAAPGNVMWLAFLSEGGTDTPMGTEKQSPDKTSAYFGQWKCASSYREPVERRDTGLGRRSQP